ncbi:MAG: glycosyltransferase [Acidobacteria bacterium]|nr:glycosyltransferase [Acidobacteriota bacterium]MCZ6833290.1 glycosyltransferase [Acidobacteriota bacterium]
MSSPHAFPRVSVVVPVLNGAHEIDRLLASLLALDWPEERLEILVVDNGSSDGTAAVAARYPVRVLEETEVTSSYAARNRGLAEACGDWIAFTDADCVVEPDWLRRLLLPAPPDRVGAIAGEVLALEGTTAVQRLVERYGIMKHAVTLPHKALPCFSTANVAVRHDLLRDLHGFRDDVRYFADMELAWRLQLEGGREILFRPDAVVRHRHRRTWGALWRQGVQHGRGVAFMKRTYPDHYRIHPAEQVRRLAGLAGAMGRTVTVGHDSDSRRAPLFLALWYGGLLAGYLMGPAPSRGSRRQPGPNDPGPAKGHGA